MIQIVQAPNPYDATRLKTIFMAGSIEMGKAVLWQEELIAQIKNVFGDQDLFILNPRRDDWNSSWVQEKENAPFHEQVSWELEGLENADCIVYFLQAGTISPITLLELGLYARSNKIMVLCEKGFHRKGNVDIVCERYGIPQYETLSEVVLALEKLLA
ncbi:nucleoside 2-deoxyribosyltransferase domain-containing protein [Taibaiella soli]|uniref:Nucleoside 2-deoxyribosyltransferase n=1 Tax=Taibaiella soli TaxID=1649169 RepID=A0A2W2AHE7_9BACT|nr:nucleoside 2-deoxyribosyltransferase domain-containing protein [Taibaiella soli]PZF71650.1 hypothetical protein DN068_16400 [Taibaiella soli]